MSPRPKPADLLRAGAVGVVAAADGDLVQADRPGRSAAARRPACRRRSARTALRVAVDLEGVQLAERAAGREQVPPAAEPAALDVQRRELRRAVRAQVDGQPALVVAPAGRVERQEPAEPAGVRPRRGDDEDGERRRVRRPASTAAQVVVVAVEPDDRGPAGRSDVGRAAAFGWRRCRPLPEASCQTSSVPSAASASRRRPGRRRATVPARRGPAASGRPTARRREEESPRTARKGPSRVPKRRRVPDVVLTFRFQCLPWRFLAHARIFFTTFPCTSVRRKSRPWKRNVSLVWSRPSRCRIVACRSWTWTRSSTTLKPSSSVLPMDEAGLDAAAGQPHREGVDVVVAADRLADLAHRRAAELAAPDHQRVVRAGRAASGR